MCGGVKDTLKQYFSAMILLFKTPVINNYGTAWFNVYNAGDGKYFCELLRFNGYEPGKPYSATLWKEKKKWMSDVKMNMVEQLGAVIDEMT